MKKLFKYGTNATLITVIFIAAMVVVNLIVGNLNLKADITKEKIFSISEQTREMLNGLTEPVYAYVSYPQGSSAPTALQIKESLDMYTAASDKIKTEYVDPTKNPVFFQRFQKDGESIPVGSVIFEQGSKFKIVNINQTFQQYGNSYSGQQSMVYIDAERQFTSAIMYVSSDDLPVVYFTQGHGEAELTDLEQIIKDENYDLEKINLITTDIPENAKVVIIALPTRDFDSIEIDKLDKFFDNGGRCIFLSAPNGVETPKLNSYLQDWGMSLSQDMIFEGDTSHYYRAPFDLIPEIKSHEITQNIISNDLRILMPLSRSVNVLFDEQRGTTVTPLLVTSNSAYGKFNLNPSTLDKEPGDLDGPLNIAVLSTKPVANGEARFLVIGNLLVMDAMQNMDFVNSPVANIDFFLNGLNWMQEQNNAQNISIRAKNITPEYLNMEKSQANLVILLVVIVIPLIVFASGGIIWFKRRRL